MEPVRVRLPRDPAAPGAARRHVDLLCVGESEQVREVVRLLTSELVTNAAEHGAGAIELSAHRHDHVIRVKVRDGSGVFPLAARPDPAAERGRGLHLVASVADGWGVLEHPSGTGKTVWFTLQVGPGRRPLFADGEGWSAG